MKKLPILHPILCEYVQRDMENNGIFPFKDIFLRICNVDLLKLSTIFTQPCIPRFKNCGKIVAEVIGFDFDTKGRFETIRTTLKS